MTKWNAILKNAVVGLVVQTLMEDNFRVEVSDFDGMAFFVYGAEDNSSMPKDGYKFWVKFHPENDAVDMINDYSTNLETTLKPVFDFIKRFED